MTETRRIVLNVAATYGRSVFSLACGLLTGRWLLMSLGEVDLGLFGVVGGLTMFISLFNEIMAGAVGRYYAVAVGRAKRANRREQGLFECRAWFTTALSVHVVIPVLLVLVGYPLGHYMVDSVLNIPQGRVEACHWVWRFTCLSCLVSMMNVPFKAMFTAKQEIAELTVYSLAQTASNACFVYFMMTHPGDWLARYAAWVVVVSSVPQVMICIRASLAYPECKILRQCLFDRHRILELARFASFRFWGAISGLANGQGESILVNKFLGASSNAAKAISYQVLSNISTLASSLNCALAPAIMNAAGEGDAGKSRRLSMAACRVGGVLMMFFMLPAGLVIHELLALWLKTPPSGTAELCICMMAGAVLEQSTEGYSQAIFADGRIGAYQFWIGNACFGSFFAVWVMLYLGVGLIACGYAFVLLKVLVVVIRLYYGQKLLRWQAVDGVREIVVPLLSLAIVSVFSGIVAKTLSSGMFSRIVTVTAATELVFVPMAALVAFSAEERKLLLRKVVRYMPRGVKV